MKDLTNPLINLNLLTEYSRIYIFSSTCETFTNEDYILGHKQNFNKFKRLEITQSKNSQWHLTRNKNKKYLEKSPNI